MRWNRCFVAFLVLALAACSSTDGPATAAPVEPATPTIPAPASPVPAEPSLGPLESAAAGDLAARLGVEPAAIELVRSEPVTWPDGSLGCPEPGKFYTQALVEGFRVILRHADRIYLYHAGNDGQPFLCPSGEADGGHDFVPPPGFDE